MVAVSERRQDVPEALERIVEKALAKDRDQRYRSCRELQADLERFLLKCGEPVGPAQIAELVKKLTPPDTGQRPRAGGLRRHRKPPWRLLPKLPGRVSLSPEEHADAGDSVNH